MKRLMLYAVVLLVLGCSKDSNPVDSTKQRGSFEIYFLKDSSLTAYEASQVDINQLGLRDDPWLADGGIDFYDFSSHCLYLKQDKSKYFGSCDTYCRFEPVLTSRPFVVVANTERCYLGSLHSLVLSSRPIGPYMDETDVGMYPADVMHISKAWTPGIDVRNDSRIQEALNSLGLCRGGISVHLHSVNIVENSDTTTVEYVFTVMNKDRDNLLLPDPDNMGTELFHYFTNGAEFEGNGVLFQSTYKQTSAPSVKWDIAWFTEVPVNASIQRTVRLKGYPHIAPGNYSCSFTFAGPIEICKENRHTAEGRIWLGEVESNEIEVVVQ